MQYRTALRQLNAGYVLVGLLLGILVILRSGFKELLRGYGSTISTLVLGLVLAEIGLFIAMFWALFHIQWSTVLGSTGVAMQSPQSLVLVVTVDLSILGACVAAMTVRTQTGTTNTRCHVLTIILLPAVMFCWVLVMEYSTLSIYINDMAQGSSLMLITGLHFTHVCFGLLVLAFGDAQRIDKYAPASSTELPGLSNIYRVLTTNVGPVLYMHFVELVWIGIHAGTYI